MTNVRVEEIMEILAKTGTEYCDIEIDERSNTVRIYAIIPPKLLGNGDSPTPTDLEGWM